VVAQARIVTPHDHDRFVPGCYRCELGRDEAMAAQVEEFTIQQLAALVRAWGNVDPGARMTRSTAAGLIATLIEKEGK
jgi:hypothetical protein